MTVVVTHTTPSDNTFSAAGAAAWDANHAITGLATVASTGAYSDLTGTPTLGTISSQNANNIAVTGGSINGATIGGTTPSTATFNSVRYVAQGSVPATPATGFSLYANGTNALSWIGANGYTRTFDGTANTANRTYTLPDSSGTIALTSNLGTMASQNSDNVTITGGTIGGQPVADVGSASTLAKLCLMGS